MKIGIPEQQDHPLAPNRPLSPITWRQAPAEPHGYYDRLNYARGWNDVVAKLKLVHQIWNSGPGGWVDTDEEEYNNAGADNSRIIYIIEE